MPRSRLSSKALLQYAAPSSTDLTQADVLDALDFLVTIEPVPAPDTREEYERALVPYQGDIRRAMATLRRFAEQTRPLTLDQMQRAYYRFSNDPRYLVSAEAVSVVTSCLNDAWDGVGPWRR